MPHVIVKMYPGRSEEQKVALTAAIVKALVRYTGSPSKAISVGIEDIASDVWDAEVHQPFVAAKRDSLYKNLG